MFETANLANGPSTKRVWATLLGFTGQLALVAFALVAPLIWPQVIPRVASAISIVPPISGPRDPKPPGARVEPRKSAMAVRPTHQFFEPRPQDIQNKPLKLDLPDSGPVVTGTASSGPAGPGGDFFDGLPPAFAGPTHVVLPPKPPERVAPVATPPTPAPAAPRRISVVELARPIHRVDPIYPKLAIISRIQGTVRLMGVLGTDGRIREIKVLSGHPLLVQAAVDAVKQWIYAPTTLNGEPVEVQAPIDVNFILNR